MALNEEQEFQLEIYYCFMLCDGQLSDDEVEELSYICERKGISEEDMKKQISYIENRHRYIEEDGSIDPERLLNAVKNLLSSSDIYNPVTQLRILWGLSSLAYADKTMSESEKSFILLVSKEWEIDDSVVSEFADIASTICMLNSRLSWVESSDMPDGKKSRCEDKIKSNIDKMISDVELTIWENV